MQIGLLAYALDRPMSGISRYTVELARALLNLGEDLELTLLTAGGAGPLADESRLRIVPLPGCRLLPGLLTMGSILIPRLVRQQGLQVVHDPTGVSPFLFGAAGAAIVVTVHDVFVRSAPGNSTVLDRLIYRFWLPSLLPRRTNMVITVSQQSAHDISKYLYISPNHLCIISEGVSDACRSLQPEVVQNHLRMRFNIFFPYILCVGSLTRRKNLPTALQAYARLRSQFPEVHLVLAGPRAGGDTSVKQLAKDLDISDSLLWTGPVSDYDLAVLYNGATLFVFPSLFEGFGLPPLEAMACGTPVICSNAGSLPEVVGDAAIMVDPHDVPALTEAMLRVLRDSDVRMELHRRGLIQARQFTWEQTARQVLKVYQQVCGVSRP